MDEGAGHRIVHQAWLSPDLSMARSRPTEKTNLKSTSYLVRSCSGSTLPRRTDALIDITVAPASLRPCYPVNPSSRRPCGYRKLHTLCLTLRGRFPAWSVWSKAFAIAPRHSYHWRPYRRRWSRTLSSFIYHREPARLPSRSLASSYPAMRRLQGRHTITSVCHALKTHAQLGPMLRYGHTHGGVPINLVDKGVAAAIRRIHNARKDTTSKPAAKRARYTRDPSPVSSRTAAPTPPLPSPPPLEDTPSQIVVLQLPDRPHADPVIIAASLTPPKVYPPYSYLIRFRVSQRIFLISPCTMMAC